MNEPTMNTTNSSSAIDSNQNCNKNHPTSYTNKITKTSRSDQNFKPKYH